GRTWGMHEASSHSVVGGGAGSAGYWILAGRPGPGHRPWQSPSSHDRAQWHDSCARTSRALTGRPRPRPEARNAAYGQAESGTPSQVATTLTTSSTATTGSTEEV